MSEQKKIIIQQEGKELTDEMIQNILEEEGLGGEDGEQNTFAVVTGCGGSGC